MKNLQIAILVFENSLKSSLFGIEEIFTLNNNFCKENDIHFSTQFVSNEKIKFVKTENLNSCLNYDIIIIPPLNSQENFDFKNKELSSWLSLQYKKGAILCSACVGSFYIASTKLLDGKRATTHWAYEELFRHNFPKVNLDSDKILIDENRVITAGGVHAYTDLCLYIIEKYNGNKIATQLANLLLIDRSRESQKSYKSFATVFLVDDEVIKDLIEWLKNNLQEPISLSFLAKKVNLSERTLCRKFKKALNITINHYLQNLRIEKAKELLISTNRSFEEITFEVGFFNESSFRKLFKRETSLNPKEFRKKFQQHL